MMMIGSQTDPPQWASWWWGSGRHCGFHCGDVLGKTLALVNQVSSFSFVLFSLLTGMVIDVCFSSSKAVLCIVLQVQRGPVLELIKWVANLLGSCIILLNGLQNAKWYFQIIFLSISNFIKIFEGCPEVLFSCQWKALKLKNKKYSDYQFEPSEWEILGFIQEVLAVCDSI